MLQYSILGQLTFARNPFIITFLQQAGQPRTPEPPNQNGRYQTLAGEISEPQSSMPALCLFWIKLQACCGRGPGTPQPQDQLTTCRVAVPGSQKVARARPEGPRHPTPPTGCAEHVAFPLILDPSELESSP